MCLKCLSVFFRVPGRKGADKVLMFFIHIIHLIMLFCHLCTSASWECRFPSFVQFESRSRRGQGGVFSEFTFCWIVECFCSMSLFSLAASTTSWSNCKRQNSRLTGLTKPPGHARFIHDSDTLMFKAHFRSFPRKNKAMLCYITDDLNPRQHMKHS